jgi:hypothetical protein
VGLFLSTLSRAASRRFCATDYPDALRMINDHIHRGRAEQ